jgi:hypothetical protein
LRVIRQCRRETEASFSRIEFEASRPIETSSLAKLNVVPLRLPEMAMRWGDMAARAYQK